MGVIPMGEDIEPEFRKSRLFVREVLSGNYLTIQYEYQFWQCDEGVMKVAQSARVIAWLKLIIKST